MKTKYDEFVGGVEDCQAVCKNECDKYPLCYKKRSDLYYPEKSWDENKVSKLVYDD